MFCTGTIPGSEGNARIAAQAQSRGVDSGGAARVLCVAQPDVGRAVAAGRNGCGIRHQGPRAGRAGANRLFATQQHWDAPEARNQAKRALKTGKVDDFIMSPIDLPDTGIDNFVKYGRQYNPNMRFFLQNNWAGFNQDGQKARQSLASGRAK